MLEPAGGGGGLDVDDLDELYPDLDGVDLEGTEVVLPEARTLGVLRSRLRACTVEAPGDCTFETRDAVIEGLDLTARRITGLVRTRLVRCRLSGADLADAGIEDVVFEDCALDLSSWRLARVTRAEVRGGRVDGLDLSMARLTDVRIADVSLEGVVLHQVRCERVDLTGADVAAVDPVSNLAGTTIDVAQAMALAGRFARGLGIRVRAGDEAFPPGSDRK